MPEQGCKTGNQAGQYTPTKDLMKQCGWMPVKHLLIYHNLILLHKVFQQKKPTFLYQKITSGSDQPNTRQAAATSAALAAAGVPQQPSLPNYDLSLSRSSWSLSSVKWYNQLPPNLLAESKIDKFKTRLKDWVGINVEY